MAAQSSARLIHQSLCCHSHTMQIGAQLDTSTLCWADLLSENTDFPRYNSPSYRLRYTNDEGMKQSYLTQNGKYNLISRWMKSTNKPSAAERFLLREKGDANSSKNNNVTFPSWVENLDKTLTKKEGSYGRVLEQEELRKQKGCFPLNRERILQSYQLSFNR